jgi:hypothetical protein
MGHKRVGTWAALLALGLAGPAWSAEAGLPPPEALAMIRDMRLTVHARRVLSEDERLRPYNLSVKVHDGVATLWGPVPSDEDGRRALRLVGEVRGVLWVRSELYVSDEIRPRPQPREGPTRVQAALPDPETGALNTLTARPPAELPAAAPESGPGDGLQPMSKAPTVQPVRLLAPVPIEGAGQPAAAPATLAAAVEQVWRGQERFRPIRVEVRGQTVVVRGGQARGEDVMALAQALRRVAGVAQVLVQD